MNRLFTLMALLFVSFCSALAQDNIKTYKIPTDCAGYTLVDNNNCMYYKQKVKNKMTYGVIDGMTKNVRWSKSYSLKSLQDVTPTSHGILVTSGKHETVGPRMNMSTSMLDLSTGQAVYTIPIGIFYQNEDFDIVIGAKKHKDASVEAYRLSTGEFLWQSYIAKCNDEEVWNNVRMIDSSHLMFVSSAIQILDLKTGVLSANSVSVSVAEADKERLTERASMLPVPFVPGFGGFIGGALIGAAVGASMNRGGGNNIMYSSLMLTGDKFSITGLQSNILSDASRYYHADSKQLVCYDRKLETVWTYTFDRTDDGSSELTKLFNSSSRKGKKGSVGKSQLYFVGDTLVMFHHAYGKALNDIRLYGVPFVAMFNKKTGEELHVDDFSACPSDLSISTTSLCVDTVYVYDEASKTFTTIAPSITRYAFLDDTDNLLICDQRFNVVHAYASSELFRKGDSVQGKTLMYGLGKNRFFIVDSSLSILRQYDGKFDYVGIQSGELVTRTNKFDLTIRPLGE